MRLRFGLRTESMDLLVEKKRCGICEDGKCELCDEGVVIDVHFSLHCGGFAGDRGALLGMIERTKRVDGRMEKQR